MSTGQHGDVGEVAADIITVRFESGIEAWFRPGDAGYVLAQEVVRLTALNSNTLPDNLAKDA